ncbi:hypothetical protein [Celeribacter baekdonensis]|uniref:hypothetical protein n=1 Tax=Celeribacter baekdonensis TaxID=875171 RepID=UPI003A93EE11
MAIMSFFFIVVTTLVSGASTGAASVLLGTVFSGSGLEIVVTEDSDFGVIAALVLRRVDVDLDVVFLTAVGVLRLLVEDFRVAI